METIINNPGLQHLAEKVFWNLDVEDLKICAQINQSSKQILENPMFWVNKFKSLSKENQKDWIKVIKTVNSDKENLIISYLQWNLMKEAVDLPCYSSPAVQDDFRNKIWDNCEKLKEESSDEDIELVKILAPLTDSPNTPNEDVGEGWTPIHLAAYEGHTEIVKILAPLTDNPNAPDEYGRTPIYWAATKGHTEIVKILAPLTDNPNALNKNGITPSRISNNAEIQRILQSFNTSRKRKAGLSTKTSKK